MPSEEDESRAVEDVEMEDAADAAAAAAAADEDGAGKADRAEESTTRPRRSTRTEQPQPETSTGTAAKTAKKPNNHTAKTKKKTKREPIVYRWVGPGTTQPDGSVVYTKLEMSVGGRAALVRTGDCALLCSGDVTEDVLYGQDIASNESPEEHGDEENEMTKDAAREVTREDSSRPPKAKRSDEESALYGSPSAANITTEEDELYTSCFDDVAINQLDPFVARIEKMWEDPPDDGPDAEQRRARDARLLGKNYDERRSRMKIQARWFYKVRSTKIALVGFALILILRLATDYPLSCIKTIPPFYM